MMHLIINLITMHAMMKCADIILIVGIPESGIFNEIFLRIFPNGTLAQNTYACLSLVCLAMLPSTKTKLAMGFVHTLINVEILVLSCALRLSEFCVIL